MNGNQQRRRRIVYQATAGGSTVQVLQGVTSGLIGSGVNGSTSWVYLLGGHMVRDTADVLGEKKWKPNFCI
jgi:hypothetical protein